MPDTAALPTGAAWAAPAERMAMVRVARESCIFVVVQWDLSVVSQLHGVGRNAGGSANAPIIDYTL